MNLHTPDGTGGVALRPLAVTDLAAFQSYRTDPEVGRFQGWSAMSDHDASLFLAEMSACPLLQPGQWLQLGIADSASRNLLGDIGLLLAADLTEVEIGFTLAPAAQGRGLGAAAVLAAVRFAFEQTPAQRVIAVTDARNLPSIRLLERIGMMKIGAETTLFRGEVCVEHRYAKYRAENAANAPVTAPVKALNRP